MYYINNTVVQNKSEVIFMSWNLNSDRPIYSQIIEQIQMDIVAGVYEPGTKLPSVREFAALASVNPNTMQKALSELERTGLIYSQRTSGRFITEDITMINDLKNSLASKQIDEFFKHMAQLGFKKEETIALLEKTIKEGK